MVGCGYHDRLVFYREAIYLLYTSQNQQYSMALFVFLCFEYIIFDACGLFVRKNYGNFLVVSPA